tara:strand:- start:26811 stop:27035 length:225 start_codon:yes stop_codon:yes gene_type:complete
MKRYTESPVFEQFGELITDELYIDPAKLTDESLAQGHNELMECPINYVYWRDLDAELNHRCDPDEHEQPMEWPY